MTDGSGEVSSWQITSTAGWTRNPVIGAESICSRCSEGGVVMRWAIAAGGALLLIVAIVVRWLAQEEPPDPLLTNATPTNASAELVADLPSVKREAASNAKPVSTAIGIG